jgi:hypothetical protein
MVADTASGIWPVRSYGAQGMPRFFFDLIYDHYIVLDPGGMLFEYRCNAATAANELARHLFNSRAELRHGRGWIRVRDERRNEIYRSSIDADARGVDTPGMTMVD